MALDNNGGVMGSDEDFDDEDFDDEYIDFDDLQGYEEDYVEKNYPVINRHFNKTITKSKMVQWAELDKGEYASSSKTVKKIPPGYYAIREDRTYGFVFQKINLKTEDLIEFPNDNSCKVISEIEKFWIMEEEFKKNKLSYKRGILLYGQPGSGKSCTLQILMNKIISDKKGLCIKFEDPYSFLNGIRILRNINPEIPVIVVMEDIDSLIKRFDESEILNVLDGAENTHNMVFIATTNYPEKLRERITNRPSRFDKKVHIGAPCKESRKKYIESLFSRNSKKTSKKEIEKWVDQTKGMMISHIKELFISVKIFGYNYEEAIKEIKKMKKVVSSEDHEDGKRIGFGSSKTEKG